MFERFWQNAKIVVWIYAFGAALSLYFGNLYLSFTADIFIIPIEDIGLSSAKSARYQAIIFSIQYFVSSFYIVTGVFLFWKKPKSAAVFVVSLLFLSYGTTEVIDFVLFEEPIYSFRFWIVNSLQALGEWLSLIVFFIFPNGRFEPKWTKPFSIFYAALVFIWLIFPDLPLNVVHGFTFNKTPILSTLTATLVHSTSLYALYHRYSRTLDLRTKQQVKWIVYGLTIAFIATFLRYLILAIFGVEGIFQFEDLFYSWVLKWWVQQTQRLLLIIVPVTFAVAILKENFWDIDLLINQTLLYSGLSAIVVTLYVIVVGTLSTFFQSQFNNLLVSLIGTGLIAVLFTPLKNLLDRSINRLLYGDKDKPYIILSKLAGQLGESQEPMATFVKVVNSIGKSLKLPYVSISLNMNNISQSAPSHTSEIIAEYGSPTDHFHSFPLDYRGETLGQLRVSSRYDSQGFTRSDTKLLKDLATQTGIVVHNYKLTHDLLQTRERLILTREEEKKRMRNDLHDSVGPQLAILYTTLTALRRHHNHFDSNLADLINRAISHTQHAKDEVRGLVDNLRPPTLDEFGLKASIRLFIQRFDETDIEFNFECPHQIPSLKAALEVAIWRIIQESITNVVKHSGATHCRVKLKINHRIHLTICDNGKGIKIDQNRSGIGLTSIRSRSDELGGSFSIETPEQGGVCLHIVLPLLSME